MRRSCRADWPRKEDREREDRVGRGEGGAAEVVCRSAFRVLSARWREIGRVRWKYKQSFHRIQRAMSTSGGDGGQVPEQLPDTSKIDAALAAELKRHHEEAKALQAKAVVAAQELWELARMNKFSLTQGTQPGQAAEEAAAEAETAKARERIARASVVLPDIELPRTRPSSTRGCARRWQIRYDRHLRLSGQVRRMRS